MSVTRPKHKYDQTREHEYDKTGRVGGKCAPCSFTEVFLKSSQLQESHARNHIVERMQSLNVSIKKLIVTYVL